MFFQVFLRFRYTFAQMYDSGAEEQLTPARVAGLGIGFVGVIVLTSGDVYDLRDSAVLSQLAVVGAAACYGAGAVYARILHR